MLAEGKPLIEQVLAIKLHDDARIRRLKKSRYVGEDMFNHGEKEEVVELYFLNNVL
jgi:hypothetical protein